jgi:glycosyltransferase involved in cell wall biosynthesis
MSRARIRVLQVVGSLATGGIETWLTHVHRHVDRTRFHIDYLVHTSLRSHYTDAVTALGATIYHCPSPRNPLRYVPSLIVTLKRHGPFDVVHSHVQHFSGVVLLAARAAGVPVRVAHCHAAGLPQDSYPSLPRHLYTSLAGRWIRRYATHKLSASHASASALFGSDPAPDGSYQVLYNGIDLEPFRDPDDRASVRAEWGISATALIAGHVGSFIPVKNHELLLRSFARLKKQVPDAWLLLVGDGPLCRSIHALARALECDQQIVFTGVRHDVPRLMRAMDVFLFPSFSEGLGLVALEAQAAGLPVIASEGVPQEVSVIPELMTWVPAATPDAWVTAILNTMSRPQPVTPQDAHALMEASPFNIARSVRGLEDIYSSGYAAAQPSPRTDAVAAR